MNSEDKHEKIIEFLARIDERQNAQMERYERERIEEREDRRKWRDDIQQDVKGVADRIGEVEKSIKPVVTDHQTIMRVIKVTGAGGTVTAFAWLWHHLTDGFKS